MAVIYNPTGWSRIEVASQRTFTFNALFMTAVAMHRLLVGVDAGRGVPEAHGDVGAQLHDTEAGHQGELEVARSLNRWRSLAC